MSAQIGASHVTRVASNANSTVMNRRQEKALICSQFPQHCGSRVGKQSNRMVLMAISIPPSAQAQQFPGSVVPWTFQMHRMVFLAGDISPPGARTTHAASISYSDGDADGHVLYCTADAQSPPSIHLAVRCHQNLASPTEPDQLSAQITIAADIHHLIMIDWKLILIRLERTCGLRGRLRVCYDDHL